MKWEKLNNISETKTIFDIQNECCENETKTKPKYQPSSLKLRTWQHYTTKRIDLEAKWLMVFGFWMD